MTILIINSIKSIACNKKSLFCLDVWFGLVCCSTSKSTAMVISGRSVHLTKLFSGANLTKQLASTLCIYFRL